MSDGKVYRASVTAPVNIAVIKYWGKRDATLNLPTNSSISVTLSQSDLHTHTTASCSQSYLKQHQHHRDQHDAFINIISEIDEIKDIDDIKDIDEIKDTNDTNDTNDASSSDTLILNGESQLLSPAAATTSSSIRRTRACIAHLRRQRRTLEAADHTLPPLSTFPLRIASRNSFPTAAGLASSASGFAALVCAVADLYGLPPPSPKQHHHHNNNKPENQTENETDLSIPARLGSGSATRSLYGGFVLWSRGEQASGLDSTATQLFPPSHWPSLRALILIASAARKAVPSTAGMQATVATSALFAHRAEEVVPRRIEAMKRVLRERDFDGFARLAMRDSNTFHAVCADTEPPVWYMGEVSRAVVRCVEEINGEGLGEVEGKEMEKSRDEEKEKKKGLLAAYTFDAGPNAVVFYLAENEARVAGAFRGLLDGKEGWDDNNNNNNIKTVGNNSDDNGNDGNGDKNRENKARIEPRPRQWKDSVSAELVRTGIGRVIVTGVGEGPRRVQEHLLDERGEAV